MLSGTPALSRPIELFPQLSLIRPNIFKSLIDFGIRYCDGKRSQFGWDFSGSSMPDELKLCLKKILLIRRLKSIIEKDLPPKIRHKIILPCVRAEFQKLCREDNISLNRNKDKRYTSFILSLFCTTAKSKLNVIKYFSYRTQR